MANCGWLWSIVWFLILLVIGFPIGFLCAFIYVLVSPFQACCGGCIEVLFVLERGYKLPGLCAQNMVSGKSVC